MTQTIVRGYKAMLDGTDKLISTLRSLAIETTAAVERLKTVEPPPLTLSRRLDRIGTSLERVASHGGM